MKALELLRMVNVARLRAAEWVRVGRADRADQFSKIADEFAEQLREQETVNAERVRRRHPGFANLHRGKLERDAKQRYIKRARI